MGSTGKFGDLATPKRDELLMKIMMMRPSRFRPYAATHSCPASLPVASGIAKSAP